MAIVLYIEPHQDDLALSTGAKLDAILANPVSHAHVPIGI